MKLIREEINNAEYIVEEKLTVKKITKLREYFYRVISKIEMEEYS